MQVTNLREEENRQNGENCQNHPIHHPGGNTGTKGNTSGPGAANRRADLRRSDRSRHQAPQGNRHRGEQSGAEGSFAPGYVSFTLFVKPSLHQAFFCAGKA